MSSWKRDIASGLIVLAPLIVTTYILAYLYSLLAGLPFLESINPHELAPGLTIPSSALRVTIVLLVWSGMRMTAFKTGKTTEDGRELLFLPTAPNITTGFVVEVEPSEFEETDESVEDALTRVLSAGFGETSESGIPIDVQDEKETKSPPPQ